MITKFEIKNLTKFWRNFTFTCYTSNFLPLPAIGMGFTTASFSLAINTYFKARRNRAVGLGMTITALGPIFIPHLVTHLLYTYSAQGAAMIMGGLTMHLVCFALLLQPVKRYMKDAPVPEIEAVPLTSEGDLNNNDSTVLAVEKEEPVKKTNFEVDYDSSDDESDVDDVQSRLERPLRKFSIVSQSVFGIEQVASMPRTGSAASQGNYKMFKPVNKFLIFRSSSQFRSCSPIATHMPIRAYDANSPLTPRRLHSSHPKTQHHRPNPSASSRVAPLTACIWVPR
jgi:hypothetical protein